MSRLDLSKEKKQYLVLGAIAAIALAVLIVFGIKVSLSSISEARLELQGLTEKIESAEKSVLQSARDEAEFRSTIAELKAHLAKIPPDRNYYSWATEIIYNEARMVRFEIDAIDETGLAASSDDSDEQRGVELESYSLRITAHGGYESVKQFLKQLAIHHPLVRVTGLEISTGTKPDVHDVQLFIEWPFNLGYIAEAWKSIREQPALNDQQPEPAVESAIASETGESGSKKEPLPPPPRSGPTTAPPGLDKSMESDIPVAGKTTVPSGSVENQPEESHSQ